VGGILPCSDAIGRQRTAAQHTIAARPLFTHARANSPSPSHPSLQRGARDLSRAAFIIVVRGLLLAGPTQKKARQNVPVSQQPGNKGSQAPFNHPVPNRDQQKH